MFNITAENTVAEAVKENIHAAGVFNEYKIDFCCKGNKSIFEACNEKGVDAEALLERLKNLEDRDEGWLTSPLNWPPDLLIDFIEKVHHRYVEDTIPALLEKVDKVARVHGNHNPELIEIRDLFFGSAEDLTAHMKKEELILFPYIKKLFQLKRMGKRPEQAPAFQTVQNPIAMMMHEHENEGTRFEKIRELSGDYCPPEHACNTYRWVYAKLEEFENDLHRHIFLENQVLFPYAEKLEKELSGEIA